MSLEQSIGLLFVFLLLVFIFIIMLIIRYRKRLLENEQMRSQYQQTILQSQLEIQEQTLKTISQEIHDNIGQLLSLAKLNLALADVDSSDPVAQRITDSHSLVSKAIQDLRDLSKSLNTDFVSEMGLERSIRYQLDMIRKTGTITTSFTVEGETKKIDTQKELILFRIIQESLNNIIRHANATEITASVTYISHIITVMISDNGKGVDLKPLNNASGKESFGLGIRNMHNRAKLIGADFKMSSTLRAGTTVTIQLPITAL